MDVTDFIEEAKTEKQAVIEVLKKLNIHNHFDYYWEELLCLSARPDFFEPCLMQYWIGKKYSPKLILEIGTRTGGSLISLLASYSYYDNIKVVSFDLWKETNNYVFLGKIPVIRSLIKNYPFNKLLALYILKKNLKLFNIPLSNIEFISGDSRRTVPLYFRKNPDIKFDYILVDGAHDPETALIDLENVSSHISRNGFILFDDINIESYNLIDIWNVFKKNHKPEFVFYESFHRKGMAWAIKR